MIDLQAYPSVRQIHQHFLGHKTPLLSPSHAQGESPLVIKGKRIFLGGLPTPIKALRELCLIETP